MFYHNNSYIGGLCLKIMARKKKEEIDINTLNSRDTLEEAVACSRLGRTIASYGSILTGREKRFAKLVYYLLNAKKEFSDNWPVTAQISEQKQIKKTSPTEAIKWFAENYPKKAQPLLAKLQSTYDEKETSVLYGLIEGKDLSDEFYVNTLKKVLEIPQHEAAVLYHGILKPVMTRKEEEEGLTGLVIK